MNVLIPVRYPLTETNKQAIRFDMEYIVLSKYRRDRWKQLLEAVLNLDQNPEQLIHEMTGITVEVITEGDHESSNP